jgi:hypothetical protein
LALARVIHRGGRLRVILRAVHAPPTLERLLVLPVLSRCSETIAAAIRLLPVPAAVSAYTDCPRPFS